VLVAGGVATGRHLVADFPIDVRREPIQADGRSGGVRIQVLKTLVLVRLGSPAQACR